MENLVSTTMQKLRFLNFYEKEIASKKLTFKSKFKKAFFTSFLYSTLNFIYTYFNIALWTYYEFLNFFYFLRKGRSLAIPALTIKGVECLCYKSEAVRLNFSPVCTVYKYKNTKSNIDSFLDSYLIKSTFRSYALNSSIFENLLV